MQAIKPIHMLQNKVSIGSYKIRFERFAYWVRIASWCGPKEPKLRNFLGGRRAEVKRVHDIDIEIIIYI